MSKGDTEHKVRTLLALARNALAACRNVHLIPKMARDVKALEQRLATIKRSKNID